MDSRALRNFKLHWALGLLLHDDRAWSDVLTVRDVAHPELNEITRAELAVDSEIKEGKLARSLTELQDIGDICDWTIKRLYPVRSNCPELPCATRLKSSPSAT
jgi:hypothetical protein